MIVAADSSPTLEAVRALSGEIAQAAAETEENRALLPQLVSRLREAGIFRMMVPKRYGGDQLTLSQACSVIEELAAADGAAGWTGMIAFGANVMLSRFSRATVDKILADGPDLQIRGAVAPLGVAIPTEGGYIISGRWPFASGPFQPQWVIAGAVVLEDGKPRMGPMGPETVAVYVPTEQVEFIDNWYSVGMRGSDSRDYEIKNVMVPNELAVNLFNFAGPQAYDVPLFNVPWPLINGPTHSAVCLGIVRAALEELGTLARTKRSAFNPTQVLGENPIFQHRFGELGCRYEAIAALQEVQIRNLMKMSEAGAPPTPLDMASNGSFVGYIHAQAVDIVNEAFSLAGSTPVYSKSPLQRRWRDVRVAAQHFGGSTGQYPAFGAIMAGQQPPMPGGK